MNHNEYSLLIFFCIVVKETSRETYPANQPSDVFWLFFGLLLGYRQVLFAGNHFIIASYSLPLFLNHFNKLDVSQKCMHSTTFVEKYPWHLHCNICIPCSIAIFIYLWNHQYHAFLYFLLSHAWFNVQYESLLA